MAQGYGQYSKAYQKVAVNTVDQRKLIVMMYDGAIKFLSIAKDRIGKGEFYEAHTNLVRGKSIIAELMGSLNLEKGGEIARNLQRIYTYAFNELIEANLRKDAARIEQVVALLKDLREGWKGIQPQPPAAPPPGDAPHDAPGGGSPRAKRISVQG
ncbi:MAG: flagellar export chaperone FliS [Candidatus Lambdaproteobacteria bacterium]|nr:flagellar export chaperone FliS [Candidatus Lambdaproteobacteria bacterium]